MRLPVFAIVLTWTILVVPAIAAGADDPKENESKSTQSAEQLSEEASVTEAIHKDIADSESLQADKITVLYHDGLVSLAGTVNNLMDKRRAADVAKRVRGVNAVLNEIIVNPSDRSDKAIEQDIVSRINANDSLEKREIVAEVQRGEAALTGKVDSLAEKRIAETAASGVRGVTDIVNQLTVSLDPDRSDQELRDEVKALVVYSVYLDDLNIDVEVDDAVVMLTGTVHSLAQQEKLRETAEIWGVKKVDVEGIKIDPDLIDQTERKRRYASVDDDQIAQSIKRAMRNHPLVFAAAGAIQPDVDDGVVTLRGTIPRYRMKNVAERVAMDVVGVRRVVNELKIDQERVSRTNSEIIDLTQAALKLSPYLYRRDFRVHCNRGHVTLYGVVDSDLEKEIAGWVAGGIPGVVHVNNALAVEREPSDKSDQQIKKDLKRKLKYAFYDSADDINVRVVDGVAVLSGTVDTWRQWQAVLDMAIEAGSKTPHNMVDVRYHPPHGASDVYVPE